MSDTSTSAAVGQDPNAAAGSPSTPASTTVTASTSSFTPSSTEVQTGVPTSTSATTLSTGESSTTFLSSISSTTLYSPKSTNIRPSVTASSTSHQKQSNTSSPSNKDVSTGALAGSIVGAFLGGCLLAFILAFLYFRKRKQKQDTAAGSYHPSSNPKSQSDSLIDPRYESAISYTTKDATNSPAAVGTTISPRYVPAPADDGTVAMKIQTLFDQISLHVENFYVRLPSNPSLQSEIAGAITQYDPSLAPISLLALLSNSKTQRAGLTHALAHIILEGIRTGSEASTLLPACFRWGPDPLRHGVSDAGQDNAIFIWRMLISHLNARNSDFSNINQSAITSLAEQFTSTFSPYKNPEFSDSDRVAHLTGVMKAASGLGTWLFAQPCLFELDWKPGNSDLAHDQLTIFPMVVKTCDEQGRRLDIPQSIVEAQMMRI